MSIAEAAPIVGAEAYPNFELAAVLLQAELERCNTASEAAERQQLGDFVTERIGVAPTPYAAEVLTAVGGILEWQLFGKPGDPLPPGLIKVVNDDMRGMTVQEDPRYAPGLFHGLLRDWDQAALGPILDTRSQRRAEQYDNLYPHMVGIFASTPLGKRLASFVENIPIAQEEKPLPAYMVVAKAELARKALANRYNVQPPRNVETDARTRTSYRPIRARIENETMLQPTAHNEEDTALTAARTYVTGLIQRAFAMQDQSVRVQGMPYFEDQANIWRLTVPTNKGLKEVGLKLFLAPVINEMYGPADCRLEDIEEIAYNVAADVFRNTTIPYAQLLETRLRQNFDTDSHPVMSAMKGSEAYWSFELHNRLKRPAGDAISYQQYLELSMHNPRNAFADQVASGFTINLASREEVDALASIKTGTVRVAPKYNGTGLRLMFLQTRDEAVAGQPVGGTPLVITLDDMARSKKDPFIPGFKLVSRSDYGSAAETLKYEFMPADEGDPYAACHVPVPAEGQATLLKAYDYLGMDGLAEKIRSNPSLTVDQLKLYIQQESVYIYPPRSSGWSGGDEKLPMFKSSVKDGKFETQCSGAAYFMKCSIDAAFGPGNAMVVGGDTIAMGNTLLDKAGHNQVSLSLEGSHYFIDSTPGSPPSPLNAQPPKSTGRVALTQPSIVPTEYFKQLAADVQLESALAEGKQALEGELLHVFKAATTDELYDKLVRLSDEDPILRSVRCLYQANKTGHTDRQELDGTLTLLHRLIANENPEAVRNLGWSGYSANLLKLVAQELARLQTAIIACDEAGPIIF
jgi:hypothetical protein